MRICTFSLWPAPTMVFFTRFGAYSATGRPASAGTSMAMPRACPSLRVADGVAIDEGLLDRGLVRRVLRDHAAQAVVDRDQPHRQRRLVVGHHRAAGEKRESVAVDHDHAPAGAAEPGIDAEDANRFAHAASLIAPAANSAYSASWRILELTAIFLAVGSFWPKCVVPNHLRCTRRARQPGAYSQLSNSQAKSAPELMRARGSPVGSFVFPSPKSRGMARRKDA